MAGFVAAIGPEAIQSMNGLDLNVRTQQSVCVSVRPKVTRRMTGLSLSLSLSLQSFSTDEKLFFWSPSGSNEGSREDHVVGENVDFSEYDKT